MHPAPFFRVVGVAAVAAVGSAALACSASARDVSSTAPTTATFAAGGLRVTWKDVAGTARLNPGQRFTVRVRATRKASRSVRARVTATRAAGDAGPKRVVVRRTLRSGTVALRVEKAPGTTYRVQIRIGKRLRTMRVVVNGPEPREPVPAPAPAPVCDPGAGALVLPQGLTAPGLAPLSIINQGGFPLAHGAVVTWERQEGAGWVAVPPLANYVATFTLSIAPGATVSRITPVQTLDTGSYRAVLPVRCADSGAEGRLYSAPVAVTRRVFPETGGSPLPPGTVIVAVPGAP